jgi:hypothetical protein
MEEVLVAVVSRKNRWRMIAHHAEILNNANKVVFVALT